MGGEFDKHKFDETKKKINKMNKIKYILTAIVFCFSSVSISAQILEEIASIQENNVRLEKQIEIMEKQKENPLEIRKRKIHLEEENEKLRSAQEFHKLNGNIEESQDQLKYLKNFYIWLSQYYKGNELGIKLSIRMQNKLVRFKGYIGYHHVPPGNKSHYCLSDALSIDRGKGYEYLHSFESVFTPYSKELMNSIIDKTGVFLIKLSLNGLKKDDSKAIGKKISEEEVNRSGNKILYDKDINDYYYYDKSANKSLLTKYTIEGVLRVSHQESGEILLELNDWIFIQ